MNRPPLPPFTAETAAQKVRLMRLRIASINDAPIKEGDRKYLWPLGRRPDDHPSLSSLGL
jgi:nuclear transport factor 2 (NTF2) superfamily protein